MGEVRFVSLVVSVAAIVDDIEDNVFIEFLAKFKGECDDGGSGQGVVSVYVNYMLLKSFAGSVTVFVGAGVIRVGGYSDRMLYYLFEEYT